MTFIVRSALQPLTLAKVQNQQNWTT